MRPVKRNLAIGWEYPDTAIVKSKPMQTTLGKMPTPIQPINKSKPTIYNTEDLINAMYQMASFNAGAAKWGKLSADFKILMNYLMVNVFTDGTNTGYGNSRGSLIENFGQYCSYCGMPVFDSSLAVEHMLPKSIFPDVMMCFPNFLLACPNCNSEKGDEPYYSWGKIWIEKFNGTKKPNYDQVKTGGYAYAVWPDDRDIGTVPINDDALTAFLFTLMYWDDANEEWKIFSEADTFNLKNIWVGTEGGFVKASLNGNDYYAISKFGFAGTNLTPQRAENMINMVSLNKYDPEKIKMSDRRAMNRTIAFFEAVAAFGRLQAVSGTPSYALLFTQILNTARYSGFYEVWAIVFYKLSPSGILGTEYMDFVTQTCNPANANAYFPGTDILRMPT